MVYISSTSDGGQFERALHVYDVGSQCEVRAAPTPDVFGSCPFGTQVLTVDGQQVSGGVSNVLGFVDVNDIADP